MPRSKISTQTEFPYHITARVRNKENFPLPTHEIWSIMEDYLFFIATAYNIEIISFVLMSNHFHLIVRAPKGNLSEAMNYFMRETSKVISMYSGTINQLWGGRFHRSLIDKEHYLFHVYKYVYRNPIEAGLCKRVGDYPYSTLPIIMGRNRMNFPVCVDSILFSSYEQTLRWLNTSPEPENSKIIKKALTKRTFKLVPKRNEGKRCSLEDSLY